tara:strand:- start:671 stop:958 length:288 start_codon:yes stop_codon:yes gene_type:complete
MVGGAPRRTLRLERLDPIVPLVLAHLRRHALHALPVLLLGVVEAQLEALDLLVLLLVPRQERHHLPTRGDARWAGTGMRGGLERGCEVGWNGDAR